MRKNKLEVVGFEAGGGSRSDVVAPVRGGLANPSIFIPHVCMHKDRRSLGYQSGSI